MLGMSAGTFSRYLCLPALLGLFASISNIPVVSQHCQIMHSMLPCRPLLLQLDECSGCLLVYLHSHTVWPVLGGGSRLWRTSRSQESNVLMDNKYFLALPSASSSTYSRTMTTTVTAELECIQFIRTTGLSCLT